jgi:hypothetical protein
VAVVGASIAGQVAARELHSEGTCACSRIGGATKIMSIFPFFPQENVSRPAHAGKKTPNPMCDAELHAFSRDDSSQFLRIENYRSTLFPR